MNTQSADADASAEFTVSPPPEQVRELIARGPGRDAVQSILSAGGMPTLRVERMFFPARKPIQVQIRAISDAGADEFLIGEWAGERAEDMARSELARLAKPRRGQIDSTAPAMIADRCSGLVLRRPGFDARLPGLRLLHDPVFAHEWLAAMGCDPAAYVTLAAHRLGRRAVLRIAGAHGLRYARLRPVASGSGRDGYDRHVTLWDALRGQCALAIPRPLAFDADLGLSLYDALPGQPPQFHGLDGFRETKALAAGLEALKTARITARRHTADDELDILDGWQHRLMPVFPDLGAVIRAPLDNLRTEMQALGNVPDVPCHRDLHEGQILVHHGRVGLVDFDTLCLGDPALDVGNMQAHLILAGLRDGRSRAPFCAALEQFLPPPLMPRIATWRRATLLRLAFIYAFSAEPREVIHGLVAGASRC